MSMQHSNFTRRHYDAMSKVERGADVAGLETAYALREVQRMKPSFIIIAPPLGDSAGILFRAILTEKGRRALAKFDGRKII